MKKITSILLTVLLSTQALAAYDPPRALSSGTDSVSVGNFPATQAVSAASLPLPSGAATSAKQDTGNTSLGSIDTKLGGTLVVNGSGVTQPISASALPLPAGAATSSAQTTGNGSLSSIDSKLSGTLAVSASALPLPSGAATESTLSTMSAKIPALGQAVMASSQPVTIASNQSTLAVATADTQASGSITTQNLNPNNGTATAGGVVSTGLVSGVSTVGVQVTGTYTGPLTPQVSVDGSNWIAITLQNINTGAMAATITTGQVGIFIADIAGARYFRLSANAAVTGTATITLNTSISGAVTGLDSAIPTGSNTIGAVTGSGTFTVSGTVTANTAVAAPIAATTDRASAAATVTGATAALTPTTNAIQFVIPVTVVSGTTPTMDLYLEESFDAGTTYRKTYSMERVTATGTWETPVMKILGTRYRWSWTIAGTTPSFTFAINKNTSGQDAPVVRRLMDRTISPVTATSASEAMRIEDCSQVAYGVQLSAAGFTPQFDLQISEDGVTYSNSGNAFTLGSTFQQGAAFSSTVIAKWARIVTVTAGIGSSLNFAWIRCRGN